MSAISSDFRFLFRHLTNKRRSSTELQRCSLLQTGSNSDLTWLVLGPTQLHSPFCVALSAANWSPRKQNLRGLRIASTNQLRCCSNASAPDKSLLLKRTAPHQEPRIERARSEYRPSNRIFTSSARRSRPMRSMRCMSNRHLDEYNLPKLCHSRSRMSVSIWNWISLGCSLGRTPIA